MLPNNQPLAVRRLTNQKQSLDKDSKRAKAYYSTAESYIAKDYARKLFPTEIAAKQKPRIPVTCCTMLWQIPISWEISSPVQGNLVEWSTGDRPRPAELSPGCYWWDSDYMLLPWLQTLRQSSSTYELLRKISYHWDSFGKVQIEIVSLMSTRCKPWSLVQVESNPENYCLKKTTTDNKAIWSEEAVSIVLRKDEAAQLTFQLIELCQGLAFDWLSSWATALMN